MEEERHHRFEPHEILDLPRQRITIPDFYQGPGWILDIGGGGEGIIGRIKGEKVISIDPNRRELEETSNDSLKVVMDAADLKFLDSTFEVVTAFFTFMYMRDEVLEAAISEISRVLKAGGDLLIWDPIVTCSDRSEKKAFISWLDIELPDGTVVETGYGSFLRELGPEMLIQTVTGVGFEIIEEIIDGATFFLRTRKR